MAQDALSIFSKYLTQDARYGINLPSETIEAIIHSICPENYARIEENCFGAGKECVHRLLGEEFYEKYLISEYHCKYMLNILENRRLQLSDILYDDLAVVYFLEVSIFYHFITAEIYLNYKNLWPKIFICNQNYSLEYRIFFLITDN